jgi:hypothetical protein
MFEEPKSDYVFKKRQRQVRLINILSDGFAVLSKKYILKIQSWCL